MRAVDLIIKKRDGQSLSHEEIAYLIEHYVKGEIPDYQMAAFCMAVYFRGMSDKETAFLTLSMANSGEVADLSPIPGIKVDKHSTGGVADSTTLVLAPLVAAAGVPVAKMSGRGLGHTGGTIDKLESIQGFRTALSREEFITQVRNINLAVAAQSGNLVPADKRLYALRDVTGTVDSLPLIASSIMSKKLAAGAEAIVLDVKTGSGAFLKKREEAEELAACMVAIGREAHRKTVAVISDMNEPLGTAIGNALEVEEAIRVLRGEVAGRLLELCLVLGARMLMAGGKAKEQEEAKEILVKLLSSGAALQKLTEMVKEQGGNPAVLEDTSLLPQARCKREVKAAQDGYFAVLDASALGIAAMILGAGRERQDSKIDLAAGIKMHKRNGDRVKQGEILATLYCSERERIPQALAFMDRSFVISHEPVKPNELVYGIIS